MSSPPLRRQMRHELKSHPRPFNSILAGHKKHDLRTNDQDFLEGDEILFREWDPDMQRYTGRHLIATITYMTRGGELGLAENLCIMSLALQYWNLEAPA
jgi:hypothetical protein